MDELRTEFDKLGIPFAYSHFQKPVDPPYIVYIGNGQTTLGADNKWHYKSNRYQLEYYFKLKNEETEEAIENLLQEEGYNYTKSEDVYIEDMGVFLIYYEI